MVQNIRYLPYLTFSTTQSIVIDKLLSFKQVLQIK